MNRSIAKNIAEKISNEQIKEMFDRAKEGIKDWRVVSDCNKGITKGTAWNILAKDFDINDNYTNLAKTNFIREFGKYLPNDLKPKKKEVKPTKPPVHQDPIF